MTKPHELVVIIIYESNTRNFQVFNLILIYNVSFYLFIMLKCASYKAFSHEILIVE